MSDSKTITALPSKIAGAGACDLPLSALTAKMRARAFLSLEKNISLAVSCQFSGNKNSPHLQPRKISV